VGRQDREEGLTVVLFDLDGTVVTFEGPPPGPGRTALTLAMRELYALENATDGVRFAGGTDRGLARRILVKAGMSDDEAAIDGLLAAYLGHLESVLTMRRYRPVGDVAGAVNALRHSGVVVGVATGNMRAGATLKLASAGLGAAFDLAMGGFGCDAEPRDAIVRIAVDRCRRGDPTCRDAKVIVVGDTEHDVRAARAVGATVVGVAVSEAARAELEAAGADAIVGECGQALVKAVLEARSLQARAPT
jgi:phosphoglycolate phosphatase